MKSAAVLLTLFASAAAFMPATPRALARTATPVREPATKLNAVEVEDDVESKIARIGVVGGLGFPILAAPFAGGWLSFCTNRKQSAVEMPAGSLRGLYTVFTAVQQEPDTNGDMLLSSDFTHALISMQPSY